MLLITEVILTVAVVLNSVVVKSTPLLASGARNSESPKKADWTSVISTLSPACQKTMNISGRDLYTVDCAALSEFPEIRFVAINNGFCTAEEFDRFTSAVCADSNNTVSSSDAKIKFYAAVNTASTECQSRTLSCILNSTLLVVLKHEEQYSSLITANISGSSLESCLKDDCSQEEFDTMKLAACQKVRTNDDPSFSNALLGASSSCMSQIEECVRGSYTAAYLISQMQYCEAFNVEEDGGNAETCLRDNDACTLDEFQMLKSTACNTAF